jgi:phosphoribosylformimino-5-aminoimidazole carboxamide ribonucleotide (ProFAR) isomerase
VVPVAVGLDHRAGNVATHGWTESSGRMVLDILGDYPSAAAFVITDISRDGMLTGPDVEGLVAAAAATTVPVIASGGVGTLDHLRDLAAGPGIEGVIVGKAIYESRFTVADAIGVLA